MAWIYIKSEPNLYTVGFYDPEGNWHPDSDHVTKEEAANRAASLNGGSKEVIRLREVNKALYTALYQLVVWIRGSYHPDLQDLKDSGALDAIALAEKEGS